ncbi:MAG TPA: TMEM175 family protein [Halococcus sp.]|nr:TMEM175 family protein [Halococcus sp.]
MSRPRDDWLEYEFDLERTIYFSDAVFAIAITLLVIDIRVPDAPAAALPEELHALIPQFLSFAISFLAIGSYWIAHHRLFRYITAHNQGLVFRNLLFLLFVALMPFSSALLGEYDDQQVAVVVYAIHLAILGLLLSWIWWYASRNRRLVDPEIDPRVVRYTDLRAVVIPLIFVVSIGVSFVSVDVAELSWLLLLFVRPALSRYIQREHPT